MAFSIAAVVGLVYWPVVMLPFIQDDFGLLDRFQKSTVPLYLALKSLFVVHPNIFYRPFGKMYLFIMYEIVGDDALWFHLIALLIHTANAFMVGLVIASVTKDRNIGFGVALVYAAAVAIHLDPLAWVVGIYDLGAMFFFLLSMLLFFNKKTAWSAAAYLVGCLFKESVIILPLILLLHDRLLVEHRTPWRTWFRQRRGDAALFAFPIGVIGVIKGYQLSFSHYSDTHPYAFALSGAGSNAGLYLKWLSQSLFPIGDYGAYISVLLILLSAIFAWTARNQRDEGRRVVFLWGWLCVGLLPVIFFPNHAFRYYATYSLAAYICLVFYVIKFISKRSNIVLIVVCVAAVSVSILQGNRVYSEGLTQATFTEGTNMLIRRARMVDLVHDGLKKYIPLPPDNAVIVLGDIDLWAFNKNSGPRFWYNSKRISVYALDDLRMENGATFIESPAESQAETYVGASSKRVDVDPSLLFSFKLVNGELVKLYPPDVN